MGKAHGLLADLFRISKELPAPLRPQGVTEGRFAPILFDYRYFKEKAAIEASIEASPKLQLLDDQFREVRLCIEALGHLSDTSHSDEWQSRWAVQVDQGCKDTD